MIPVVIEGPNNSRWQGTLASAPRAGERVSFQRDSHHEYDIEAVVHVLNDNSEGGLLVRVKVPSP
jgi:hypothetical protein